MVAEGALISALIYVLLPTVANEINQGWATNIKQRAEELAKKIYTKISKNGKMKEQLMDAYNNKNNDLLSQLVNQAGYSVQASSLRKQVEDLRSKYKQDSSKITDEGTELTNQYNKLINATNNAGTSISSNVAAEQTLKQMQNLVDGGTNNV